MILKPIDYLLNRITMYRLVLYYLIALLLAAIGLSLAGYVQFNALSIAFSAGYLTIICWLSNKVFAYYFEVPVNVESVYITALILALIVTPYKIPHDILFLTAVGGLAIASKFILAIRKKHIFNPAAVAVALTAVGAGQTASWWVGTSYLLPFVVIGGLLVIRKTNRGFMVLSFFVAAAVSTLITSLMTHHAVLATLQTTALHSSLFFLAFVMLTEPFTSPTTRHKQLWYGVLAGLLFPPEIHFFSLYSTPELALLVANVFAYIVSPKVKLLLTLKERIPIATDTVNFVFKPKQHITYKPGQYMEWTLPHDSPDNRGNRRVFTLASSPTEDTLQIGVKFYPESSSFKHAMFNMNDQTKVAAGQLGGDFVMPDDRSRKLVFIAGGIGITPYRSMVKYMLDTNERRDITLLYFAKNSHELSYTNIFNAAARLLGLKVVYTVTDLEAVPPDWQGQTGPVSAQMLASSVPDYQDRLFYISGPHNMVSAVQGILRSMDVPNHQIKTDYFSGYA